MMDCGRLAPSEELRSAIAEKEPNCEKGSLLGLNFIVADCKFSGESKEDFEVWLADYCEATGDCGWSDESWTRWFAWFLSGTAKHT